MNIQITTINVGDADAIIVSLQEDRRKLVALIDAGRRQHSDKVLAKVDDELKRVGKPSPDLVVVSHCDSDHIGGIPAVLDKYRNKIREIWIHQPYFSFNEGFSSYRQRLLTLFEDAGIRDLGDNMELVIESFNELNDVVTLAESIGIEIKEPFLGECSFSDWPQIKVIGPTRSYYNTVFRNIDSLDNLVLTETSESSFLAKSLNDPKRMTTNPCAQLPNKSRMQPTNRTSAIVKIVVDNRSYLFTGDAEIESFWSLPNCNEELKDIFWLKVPHHGSINNISEELIKLMKPKYVHVSGNAYVDPRVVECLKQKGYNVRITTSGDLIFPRPIEKIHMSFEDIDRMIR